VKTKNEEHVEKKNIYESQVQKETILCESREWVDLKTLSTPTTN